MTTRLWDNAAALPVLTGERAPLSDALRPCEPVLA
jgi:hypothetical protein